MVFTSASARRLLLEGESSNTHFQKNIFLLCSNAGVNRFDEPQLKPVFIDGSGVVCLHRLVSMCRADAVDSDMTFGFRRIHEGRIRDENILSRAFHVLG